ncbi:MAG: extracellular solute-binding protein [Clostridiales bacterium]|jgi:raffinose/stachyose/melibiose transport system substrate-binding protein|nr:extracellular solute-binding protein [Clostridiales bacterium]
MLYKKRLFQGAALAVISALTLTACGGGTGRSSSAVSNNTKANTSTSSGTSSTTNTSNSADTSTTTTTNSSTPIRLLNGKVEIDEQLQQYASNYEKKTGQKVIIESVGGGVDITATIKNYNAAGNMPDIFVTTPGDLSQFRDLYYDLSNEPWVQDTEAEMLDSEGRVVGAPYAVEGIGLVYNADILAKADINPDTLVNINEQRAAFEKLDAMKDELGLQSVISVAAESGQMYWSTGNHIFSAYLTMGVDVSDKTLLNDLLGGNMDAERLGHLADYFKLLCSYADPTVLLSGTYDDQLALFAQGKAAFITQGNWIDPSLPTYGATFDCGILPYAMFEEDTSGVTADAPSWWAVFKDGKNVPASIAFLNDILMSDEGRKMFVEDAGAISAFKSSKYAPSTPVSANLFKRMQAGPTYAWDWSFLPASISQNSLAPVFELYAKDEITRDQFVSMIMTSVTDYVAENQ